ncbi:hypothetical protein [Methylocaldum marinum]|nr:hypothetical protein [Methylocaldum marinum]
MKSERNHFAIVGLMLAAGLSWQGITYAATLRFDFEATVTDIRDSDAPFDDIAIGDVAQGYFEYVTEAFDVRIPDGGNIPGPTHYWAGLPVFQKPPTFVTASVTIGDHVFNPYELGGAQEVSLWDEPPTPAGFDQFSISHISQASAGSATTALMAVGGTIQLIDALADEELVQQFEWSAALEPDRAFLRPFALEFIQPNTSSVHGRSRLEIVGDLTYARLAPVPLPSTLPLLGSVVAFAALALRKHRQM